MPHATQRCFYGSEHGKGEADGETGVMSQALKRANYQGQNFNGAEDMCQFLSTNYGSEKRHYIHIENIDRIDLPDDILVIPGTRKLHQFQTVRPYQIRARRLACFCTACKNAMPDRCINLDVVGAYVLHKCKPSIQTVLNEAFVESPSIPETSTSTSNGGENQRPIVGDYVKLSCMFQKAKKIFYAVVIDVVDDTTFSVRFLQKRNSFYTFGQKDDEGLVKSGPPDFYTWRVLSTKEWTMDTSDHHVFFV